MNVSDTKTVNKPHLIQIVYQENHELKLTLEEPTKVLGADDIKDRQIVVVSIAGAFRKGKSFLLNFFLRYLNAQVLNPIEISKYIVKKNHPI